jgi:hypothetical protein
LAREKQISENAEGSLRWPDRMCMASKPASLPTKTDAVEHCSLGPPPSGAPTGPFVWLCIAPTFFYFLSLSLSLALWLLGAEAFVELKNRDLL